MEYFDPSKSKFGQVVYSLQVSITDIEGLVNQILSSGICKLPSPTIPIINSHKFRDSPGFCTDTPLHE